MKPERFDENVPGDPYHFSKEDNKFHFNADDNDPRDSYHF